MYSYVIYLVLLVPSSVGASPLEMPAGAVRAAFGTDAACNAYGSKLASDLQTRVPAKNKAIHRCERGEVML